MKHVLCAHLRQWPIDRLCRRRPELRRKALALVQTVGGRQIVAHVSPATPPDVRTGMTLAEARARHADLIHLPATPADDLRSLEALGRWLTRFSPCVGVDLPAALFLDATGLERLFGSLDHLRHRVAAALASLRIAATVAIAPTFGAARALAAFGPQQQPVITEDSLPHALAPLPVESLRIDAAAVERLGALGVGTVGALLRLGRDDLAVRFGPALLRRIDQATGAVHEPLVFLEHHAPVGAVLEFDGVVDSLEVIHLAFGDLVRHVVDQLARRGLGAGELRVMLRPPYTPLVEKSVHLARPCRDESIILNLVRCALETLQPDEGVIAIGLSAPATQRLGDEQPALIGGERERNAAELDHLVERLRARLDRAVQWAQSAESHIPEETFHTLPTLPPQPSPGVPGEGVGAFRPLCLLPEPRAVRVIVMPSESGDGPPASFADDGEVHRLVHVRGPERIGGQWWNGRWKTRDYFDALDESGRRYWLFRVVETGRWFLHGVFE